MPIPETGVIEHQIDPREMGVDVLSLVEFVDDLVPLNVHIVEFSSIPLHIDNVRSDLVYIHQVLYGEFQFVCGDSVLELGIGDVLEMNPRIPHLVNARSKRVICLCMELGTHKFEKN